MICTKCGRKSDKGKYCTFCGAMLHEKNLDFENTNTLMRSNIKVEDISKNDRQYDLNDNGVKEIVREETSSVTPANPKEDSTPVSPSVDESFIEDIERSVESKISFLSELPDVNQRETNVEINDFVSNDDQCLAESSFVEEIKEEPQVEETVIPVEEVVLEEVTAQETEEVSAEPESEDAPTEEIKKDISYDSFSDLMSETAEEEPQVEETVIPVEEVVLEEVTAQETEEVSAEPESEDAPTEEIKKDISYDSFSDLMSETAEEEPQVEETVIPVEEITVQEKDEVLIEEPKPDVEQSDISTRQISGMRKLDVGRKKEIEEAKTQEVSIPYSEIDPMFGPPPTMNFTAKQPQPQKSEKKGFFKRRK